VKKLLFVFAIGCATASTPSQPTTNSPTPAAPAPSTGSAKDPGLSTLMRNRMNKSYTQLMYYLLDSAAEADEAKVTDETKNLQAAVAAVRALPMPQAAQSEESRSVYSTYNDVLQQNVDKFAEAVAGKDRPQMEAMLGKIGKTCNDCHKFFRVEIKDQK